jgi:outer membrane protein assembly factor BamE (lipoprotein component of BamABCDE complex)
MRLLPALALSSFCCWFAGCSSPTAATSAEATVKPTAESNSDMPFPKLEKGMSADVIRQKLGNPAEIQPMPSPDGKAEIWIYKFEKDLGMTQVAAGTRDVEVMTMTSSMNGSTTMKEPVYTMAAKKSEITLSLLMFNGQLQVQKAKVEETIAHQ